MTKLEKALDAIHLRAKENLEKWGDFPRADSLWLMILVEEVGEVAKAMLEGKQLDFMNELLDCAAVVIEWLAERLTP